MKGVGKNLRGKWAGVGEILFFVGQMSYFDIFVAMKDITVDSKRHPKNK